MSVEENTEVQTDVLAVLLGQIWNGVIAQVNRLLEAHNKFDFVAFKANLNPSLEEVLAGFEFVDFALSKLLDSKLLGYDEIRDAINSKQCILKMRELTAACDGHNKVDYERVIDELKKQSKF